MSWRKFITLLSGLSGDSLFINKLGKAQEIIEDPEEAEKAVQKFWK